MKNKTLLISLLIIAGFMLTGATYYTRHDAINIMDYGATGTGDDTTAIQNAINAAQAARLPLIFPPCPSGETGWKISNTLILTAPIHIIGMSKSSRWSTTENYPVRIEYIGETNVPMIQLGNGTDPIYDVVIESIVLDGAGIASENLVLNGAFNCIFRNVTARYTKTWSVKIVPIADAYNCQYNIFEDFISYTSSGGCVSFESGGTAANCCHNSFNRTSFVTTDATCSSAVYIRGDNNQFDRFNVRAAATNNTAVTIDGGGASVLWGYNYFYHVQTVGLFKATNYAVNNYLIGWDRCNTEHFPVCNDNSNIMVDGLYYGSTAPQRPIIGQEWLQSTTGRVLQWSFAPTNTSTTVDQNSASGGSTLYVASTSDFAVGDIISINRGGERHEYAQIASIDAGVSFTLTDNFYYDPLIYTHTAVQADVVTRIAWTPVKSYAYMKLYVDLTSGTDGPNYGTSTGASAFKTIQYARSVIPNDFVAAPGSAAAEINVSAGTVTLASNFFFSKDQIPINYIGTWTEDTAKLSCSGAGVQGTTSTQGSITDTGALSVTASSTVDATGAENDNHIHVESTTNFTVGGVIVINPGGAREEVHVIKAIAAGDYLSLEGLLEYEHTSGDADEVVQGAYAGKFILFESDTTTTNLKSDYRIVAWNTADKLTIVGTFDAQPQSGDTYKIVEPGTIIDGGTSYYAGVLDVKPLVSVSKFKITNTALAFSFYQRNAYAYLYACHIEGFASINFQGNMTFTDTVFTGSGKTTTSGQLAAANTTYLSLTRCYLLGGGGTGGTTGYGLNIGGYCAIGTSAATSSVIMGNSTSGAIVAMNGILNFGSSYTRLIDNTSYGVRAQTGGKALGTTNNVYSGNGAGDGTGYDESAVGIGTDGSYID